MAQTEPDDKPPARDPQRKRVLSGLDWRVIFSRGFSALLGIVMLSAGLIKAADMGLFVVQIKSYGIVSDPRIVAALALALIVTECGLGAALLLYYRPRWSLFGVNLLLLIFIVATAWAWQKGLTEDCGCFGALVKRTPGHAMAKDLVLLEAGISAFLLSLKTPGKPSSTRLWLVITACLTGLLLPIALGFPLPHVFTPQSGVMPLGKLHLNGEPAMDLSRGTFLIAVMDTDCIHCQAAVPALNDIAADGKLPMVVGVCKNNAEDIDYYIANFAPQYPVYSVPENEFWRLAGSATPPRYLLVKKGVVVKTWEQNLPPLSELKK